MRKILTAAIVGLCAWAAAPPQAARAETNMLFIMDASNSMWGQIDGTAKIATAKTVMDELLGDLPAGTRPGLMVYGHRSEGDCADVELVSSFGDGSAESIRAAIQGLQPRGKTPIAASLEQSAAAFSGREEENNAVVLISDGIETCEGDPCAVAGTLIERGINVRVHVVGFDVDADTRAQLQCIAEAGQGSYFDADSAEGFKEAVTQAQAAAVEAAPEPEPEPEPTVSEYFRDDFDGGDLSDFWTVEKPDPDNFIVEDGVLLLVDTAGGMPGSETANNIMRLAGTELPKEDFVATVEVEFAMQTAREMFQFGVYEDPVNYVLAEVYTFGDGNYGWGLTLRVSKQSGDTNSNFTVEILRLGCNICREGRQWRDFIAMVPQPLTIQLVKEGRSLYARAKTSAPDAQWFETDKVTTLRLKGDLMVNVAEYEDRTGEAFGKVDLIKIETSN